jgi:hypothetical protein
MSSIATTNETSSVTSLPTAPEPQTSKEVIAADVKLRVRGGHSEGLTAYLAETGRFDIRSESDGAAAQLVDSQN